MLTSWSLLFTTTKYCVSIHHWKKKSDQHSKIYCLRYSIGSWHTNSKDFFKLSAIQRNGTQSNKDMKCDAWDFQIGNWPSQNEHGILWSSSFFSVENFRVLNNSQQHLQTQWTWILSNQFHRLFFQSRVFKVLIYFPTLYLDLSSVHLSNW